MASPQEILDIKKQLVFQAIKEEDNSGKKYWQSVIISYFGNLGRECLEKLGGKCLENWEK